MRDEDLDFVHYTEWHESRLERLSAFAMEILLPLLLSGLVVAMIILVTFASCVLFRN